MEKKLEFIYKAIEDTTNTIRAIDTKINYIFVAIGLVFALMGIVMEEVLEVYNYYKSVSWMAGGLLLLLISYGIMTIRSVWYGYKTLLPKNNPEQHVDSNGISPNKLWYLVNNKEDKISIPLKDYCEKIKNLTIDELMISSSFELMKLSYIRNLKLQNSERSIFSFIISVGVFSGIIILVSLHYFILI